MANSKTRPGHYGQTAVAYFAERGIDVQVAAEAGVRENGNALEFPYPSAADEQFARVRSLNGAGPKVKQPKGHPLGLWQPVETDQRHVVVCEGESDALAAMSAVGRCPLPDFRKLPVVAVPGTGYPVGRVAEQLEATGATQAWLILDADQAGRDYTAKLVPALVALGIKTFVVELPDRSDLADCLAAQPAGERGAWIANTLRPGVEHPQRQDP